MEAVSNNSIEILNNMIGKSYQHNGQVISIQSFDRQGERIIIKTDKKDIEVLEYILPSLLQDFTPCLVQQVQVLPTVQIDGNVIKSLKDTLLDNISRVRNSKDFIPQAEAIAKNVDGVINLAKIELEYLKVLKGLK